MAKKEKNMLERALDQVKPKRGAKKLLDGSTFPEEVKQEERVIGHLPKPTPKVEEAVTSETEEVLEPTQPPKPEKVVNKFPNRERGGQVSKA